MLYSYFGNASFVESTNQPRPMYNIGHCISYISLSVITLLTPTHSIQLFMNKTRLDKIEPDYWVICACIAGLAELSNSETKEAAGKSYTAGDCGFDPLKFMPEDKVGKMEMQTKEIKHGRIAMMAILGYVVQEALYRAPVTAETPFFFQPIF